MANVIVHLLDNAANNLAFGGDLKAVFIFFGIIAVAESIIEVWDLWIARRTTTKPGS